MDASIKDPNIKNFVRLLQCASKFGDDLNIHANKDLWEMAVTNSSKSAFCLFKLRKEFFCRWKPQGTSVQQRRGVKCRLLVKSVLAVLGKASSVNNVDRIDLKIYDPDEQLHEKRRRRRSTKDHDGTGDEQEESEEEQEEQGRGSILIMKLVCKHGVTKKHSLHLASTEFLRAEVDPDTTPSGFKVSARSLRDMLDHFSIAVSSSSNYAGLGGGVGVSIKAENQLGWMFAKHQVRIKSWDGANRDLSTEIVLDPEEFDEYEVYDDRVDLTLPMKEFRATLSLAEQLGISLTIAFSRPTQPLTLTYNPQIDEEGSEDAFSIFCAIATTSCDAFDAIKEGSEAKPTRSTSITSDTASRPRASASEQPRKRARLSMAPASQPTRVMSQREQVNVVVNSAPARVNAAEDHQREGLFLPGASQGAPASQQQEDETMLFPQTTQSRRMTQQEVLEVSGLGELDAAELLDEMDDLQDEEEREEMRLRGENEDNAADENIPPQQVLSGVRHESATVFQEGVSDELHFEPDYTIFNNLQGAEQDDTSAPVTAQGDISAPGAPIQQTEQLEDEIDEDDTLDLPPTQHPSGENGSNSRRFTSFFDD
ncbi:Rad9-domain-containing protein [Naematelia encephala]|uniref:Rad9-domain-containing protein n=1 Tax=Naematelia encephala TaxID=71784 RepID=A0A1Y2BJP5_9TREE|nr:Rad9-domain-containing protein [Naematelia encephala]